MVLKILVLAGDGVGAEVTCAGVQVLEAVAKKFGVPFTPGPATAKVKDADGNFVVLTRGGTAQPRRPFSGRWRGRTSGAPCQKRSK